MTTIINQIQSIRNFSKTVINPLYKDRYLYIDECLSSDLYDSLKNLEALDCSMDISYENNPIGGVNALFRKIKRKQNGNVNVKIELPRTDNIIYASDLDDILTYQDFSWKKPDFFYISEWDYFSDNNKDIPSGIKAYNLILEFINLLIQEETGNHHSKKKGDLSVFLLGMNKKLQLDIVYSQKQLDFDLLYIPLNKLFGIISEKVYKDTKFSLLRKTLIDFLIQIPQKDRFKYLLNNMSEFTKQFHQNYELFLSEFEFENEREKIENVKREYLLGLNKVFDDIQNKILAIPASLILIGSQMKYPQQIDTKSIITNSLILIGSFIFTWIMFLMTRNQLNTLQAIRNDFSLRKKRIKSKLNDTGLYKDLEESFTILENRYGKQCCRLWIINSLVIFGFLVTIALYEYTISFSTFFSLVNNFLQLTAK
jgi:hypothetical protein